MAQFYNPATGGQGYLDGAGHLGLLTWLGLDWLVSLLCLETQAELDLLIRKGSLQKGTVALHKGCIVSGSY